MVASGSLAGVGVGPGLQDRSLQNCCPEHLSSQRPCIDSQKGLKTLFLAQSDGSDQEPDPGYPISPGTLAAAWIDGAYSVTAAAYTVTAWFARVATTADILRPVSTAVSKTTLIVTHTGASPRRGATSWTITERPIT